MHITNKAIHSFKPVIDSEHIVRVKIKRGGILLYSKRIVKFLFIFGL